MKKEKFILMLCLQIVFRGNLFSQSQNEKFMIAWYDYAYTTTPDSTIMTQRYKDMQAHYINCAITDKRLISSGMGIHDSTEFCYASSNPSKSFMDSAYMYNIKILLTTPDNSNLGINTYDSVISQQGLAYWGAHPA